MTVIIKDDGPARAQFDGAIRSILREQIRHAKKAGAIEVTDAEWLVDAVSTQISDLLENMEKTYTLEDFVEAYTRYEGQDVSGFVGLWSTRLGLS